MPNIAEIASAARMSEDGIARFFANANFPSPEVCKKAAWSFRNTLYTLKAKARRHARRLTNGLDDSTIYDDISALVEETPEGYWVTIKKVLFDKADFVDVKTGQPVENWPDLAD